MSEIPLKNYPPAKQPSDSHGDQYANFMAIASHDLQAPLRKLGVLTDRLVARFQETPGEEVVQYTNRIHACISEMQALIDGFSELAAASRNNMDFTDCDLNAMMEKMLREFAGPIRDKQATITIGPLSHICGDKTQLKLAFRRILDNAFKFSRESVPLQVEISSKPAKADEILKSGLPPGQVFHKITISDNGIGFDAGEAENIFQPLVRLHGKSSFRGNGLGLSLVKRIVENHNGVVFAEGTKEGAVITLLLPENQS